MALWFAADGLGDLTTNVMDGARMGRGVCVADFGGELATENTEGTEGDKGKSRRERGAFAGWR